MVFCTVLMAHIPDFDGQLQGMKQNHRKHGLGDCFPDLNHYTWECLEQEIFVCSFVYVCVCNFLIEKAKKTQK